MSESPREPEHWQVLVEEPNSDHPWPPTKVHVLPELYVSKDDALARALEIALDATPTRQAHQLGRDVYREGDGYRVLLHARGRDQHFVARVVQHVAHRQTDRLEPQRPLP